MTSTPKSSYAILTYKTGHTGKNTSCRLVMDSTILVVDEPTTGMDLRASRSIMSLLQQWHKNGETIIVITYDMNIDARVKMTVLATLFFLLLTFNYPFFLAILIVFVFVAAFWADLRLKQLTAPLAAALWFMILSVLLWPFYYEQGGIFIRLFRSLPIIGPLFLQAIDLAQSLAVARDARGFAARDGRTSLYTISMSNLDKAIAIACGVLLVVSITARILGIGVLVEGHF